MASSLASHNLKQCSQILVSSRLPHLTNLTYGYNTLPFRWYILSLERSLYVDMLKTDKLA